MKHTSIIRTIKNITKVAIVKIVPCTVSDSVHIREVQRFAEYIDARPFQLYVLHLIPLDYKFPFIFMNIYVTYTVVIAQFAHRA